MNSDFSLNIIVTATCVLVSALLTKIIMLGFKRNHLGFVMIWLFIFPVTLFLSFVYGLPLAKEWRSRAVAITLLEEDPLIQALAVQHSVMPRELLPLMTEIVSQGHRANDARLVLFRRSFAYLVPHFEKHIPVAGDAAIRRYVNTLFRVASEVEGRPGAPCYWILTGSPLPDGSSFAGVSEVEIVELRSAMTELVRGAMRQPQTPLTEDEQAGYRLELRNRLEQRHGEGFIEEMKLLNAPVKTDSERRRVCIVIAEMISEARSLPIEHRETALRALLSPP